MSGGAAERRELLARAGAGRVVPVARAFASDELTPVTLFKRMRASGQECFLLESVEGGEAIARYTFLGCGPSARLTIRGKEVFEERNGRTRRISEPPLEALRRLAVRPGFEASPGLPPLTGGAVGYLGYDAVRIFEEIPDRHAREEEIPDGLFLLFESVVAFDHPRQQLFLLTSVEGESDVDAALARLDALELFVRNESGAGAGSSPAPTQGSPARETGMSRAAARPLPPDFEASMPRQKFLDAVQHAREHILAGDIYQVVLSLRWTGALEADPFDVYRALRMLNPSPYLFYLETREAAIFGSSPEMLVRCRGRSVETRPIAGTAPRGATPEEDAQLGRRLLADPKERSEHVMLVDLGRNDLGRVCAIGSVEVPRYASIEKYSHVQHLVSEVRGTLAEGRSSLDALAACFPAGTLTGAPKIRAMEIIDALEETRRGIYGGAVGYLDFAGNCDMAIAIRTAVVARGQCRVQAGAGIVADSIPEKEYAEAESKAQALFQAIATARSWK